MLKSTSTPTSLFFLRQPAFTASRFGMPAAPASLKDCDSMKKMAKRAASCSDAQQLAEHLMVSEFSRQLGRELGRATIPIGKNKVTVDGFHRDDNRVTLVEAWAHIGKAKSAQRNKVLGDMLKLAFVSSVLRKSYPTINVESHLIFADVSAASVVTGDGWAALAANEFGIAMQVIALPKEVISTIKEAQRRQDIRVIDDCAESDGRR